MQGTTYVVTLSLQTSGSFATQVGQVGQKAAQAHSHVSSLGEGFRKAGEYAERMGGRVGGLLSGVADSAAEAAVSVGKIAGAMGVGLATYGVAKLNNELEQTQISLGAIAQAQGFVGSFSEGFAEAGAQLKAMKQEVKSLPGDLGQLSGIMKMIATPAAQAHADMNQIRGLAGRTMLTSTILGVPQEVASREMAGLLSGRAGSHNILGARLGLIGNEAEKFNKMAPEARLARINAELDKYQGAANRFSQSFVAQWTTLKDNMKYSLLAPATSPLFEHVKASLISINAWFDHNQDRVQAFTNIVGHDLAAAWDKVAGIVAKIDPLVGKAVDKLSRLKASDVEHFATSGAVSIAATGIAGRAISGGSSLVGGAMGATGAAAKFAGSAPAMEAMGTALTFLANPVTLGAAAGAAALLATGAVALAGAIHALTDDTSAFHDRAVALWGEILSSGEDAFGRLRGATSDLYASLVPVADSMGTTLLFALREIAPLGAQAGSGLQAAAAGLRTVLHWASKIPGSGVTDPDDGFSSWGNEGMTGTSARGGNGSGGKGGASEIAKAISKLGGGGGGGGTHIGKVDIRVEGAGDPQRIARLVGAHLEKLGKNPKTTQYVHDYTKVE